MGTNLAAILASIYMTLLEEELYYAHGKTLYGLKCLKDSSMMDSESLKATKNKFLDGLRNSTTCGKIFL